MQLYKYALLTWILLLVCYWFTYFKFRILIKKSVINKYFWINTVILIVVVITLGIYLIRFGLLDNLYFILISVMFIGEGLHHLILYLEAKKKSNKMIKLLHGPITHSMFFIPFGYLTLILGLSLYTNLETLIFKLVLVFCVTLSLILSFWGIWVGFRWNTWRT